jgi:hypothetical protein
MSPTSKALTLAAVPALLLALLVITGGPGEAVIDKAEREICDEIRVRCKDRCNEKAKECGKVGSANYENCYDNCVGGCEYGHSDCLRDADKTAPTRRPTMQPKPIDPTDRPIIQRDRRPPEYKKVVPKHQPEAQEDSPRRPRPGGPQRPNIQQQDEPELR